MTPQMLLKARFGELAESLNVDLVSRKQGDKFYFTITGEYASNRKFIAESFPKAWMTSAATNELIYRLPDDDVERLIAGLEAGLGTLQTPEAAPAQIARRMRAEKNFDSLPILADALEEAGCAIPGMVNHCREQAPHTYTCWVIDLLLGPERSRRRRA